MSDMVQSNRMSAVVTHLSEEFRQVVERIQGEARDLSLGALEPDVLEPDVLAWVEAAEQTVDARALDFQHGVGDQAAWQAALAEYETAWLRVVRSLGERKN